MAKKGGELKKMGKVLETDVGQLRKKAMEVEKALLTDVTKIKEFLEHVQAKIEDSKISVDINKKGDVEIEFSIKALIRKK